MQSKTVFQTDRSGLLLGFTQADQSPLEPGVYMIPAGCVETAPPFTWDEWQWPRWNGRSWDLVTKPKSAPVGLLSRITAAIEAFKRGN